MSDPRTELRCKRGHSLLVEGTFRNGYCKRCSRESHESWKERNPQAFKRIRRKAYERLKANPYKWEKFCMEAARRRYQKMVRELVRNDAYDRIDYIGQDTFWLDFVVEPAVAVEASVGGGIEGMREDPWEPEMISHLFHWPMLSYFREAEYYVRGSSDIPLAQE